MFIRKFFPPRHDILRLQSLVQPLDRQSTILGRFRAREVDLGDFALISSFATDFGTLGERYPSQERGSKPV